MSSCTTESNNSVQGCTNQEKSHLNYTGRPSAEQAVVILVNFMFEVPNDEELQLRAMISLMRMSSSDENRCLLGESGTIQTCLQAMRTFPQNRNITNIGCMFLTNLAFDNEENKTRIRNCSGMETVLRLMKHLEGDEEFQTWACLLFRNITSNFKSNQLFSVHIELLEILHQVLKRFEWNSGLQIHGITAIANIAGSGLDSQMRIREKGCIQVIVDAMRTHSSTIHVQEHCMNAIRKVCDGNPRNQNVVREFGAVELLSDLMKKPDSSTALKVDICCTMRILCFEESIREIIGKNGTVLLIVESLESISKECGGEEVEIALKALSNATYSPDENKHVVVSCGGIEKIMKVLETRKNEFEVVDAGLRVFRNISDKGGVNCQMLASNGAYSFALDRVDQFSDNGSVLEHYLAMVINAVSLTYNERVVGIPLDTLQSFVDDQLIEFSNHLQVRKLGEELQTLLAKYEKKAQEASEKKRGAKLMLFGFRGI